MMPIKIDSSRKRRSSRAGAISAASTGRDWGGPLKCRFSFYGALLFHPLLSFHSIGHLRRFCEQQKQCIVAGGRAANLAGLALSVVDQLERGILRPRLRRRTDRLPRASLLVHLSFKLLQKRRRRVGGVELSHAAIKALLRDGTVGKDAGHPFLWPSLPEGVSSRILFEFSSIWERSPGSPSFFAREERLRLKRPLQQRARLCKSAKLVSRAPRALERDLVLRIGMKRLLEIVECVNYIARLHQQVCQGDIEAGSARGISCRNQQFDPRCVQIVPGDQVASQLQPNLPPAHNAITFPGTVNRRPVIFDRALLVLFFVASRASSRLINPSPG